MNEIKSYNTFGEDYKKMILNKSGKPVTTSRIIAYRFGKKHKIVLKAINNLDCSEDFSRHNFVPSNYKLRGKSFPEYIISRDGFMFLVMGFTGSQAAQFKEIFIRAFTQMEEHIKNRQQTATAYLPLSEAINHMKNGEAESHHFSNEAEMINRIVLNKSSKQFREEFNLRKENNIRNYISKEQLKQIEILEKIDTGLILEGISDFYERKKRLTEAFEKQIRKTEII